MKNIFSTIVFSFFLHSSYLLCMHNQISSLEEIKFIEIKNAMNLAYLSNNKILMTAKDPNAFYVFDCNNQDQVFFQLAEPVGRIIIERDIYGKNVYLARKASKDGQLHKVFFYNEKTNQVLIENSTSQYRCLSRQNPDCYLSQDQCGKVFIHNIMNNSRQECSVLSDFFEKKKILLHTFCPKTNQIIYDPNTIFDQNLYWCDLSHSNSLRRISQPESCDISADETFCIVENNKEFHKKNLISPYGSAELTENMFSDAFGAAITPDSRMVIIVTRNSIQFWDSKKVKCISRIENEGKEFSPAGKVISIAPDGKAFAILSTKECSVYKMPFIIKNYQYIGNFALLQVLLNAKNNIFPLSQDILNIFKRYLVI